MAPYPWQNWVTFDSNTQNYGSRDMWDISTEVLPQNSNDSVEIIAVVSPPQFNFLHAQTFQFMPKSTACEARFSNLFENESMCTSHNTITMLSSVAAHHSDVFRVQTNMPTSESPILNLPLPLMKIHDIDDCTFTLSRDCKRIFDCSVPDSYGESLINGVCRHLPVVNVRILGDSTCDGLLDAAYQQISVWRADCSQLPKIEGCENIHRGKFLHDVYRPFAAYITRESSSCTIFVLKQILEFGSIMVQNEAQWEQYSRVLFAVYLQILEVMSRECARSVLFVFRPHPINFSKSGYHVALSDQLRFCRLIDNIFSDLGARQNCVYMSSITSCDMQPLLEPNQ